MSPSLRHAEVFRVLVVKHVSHVPAIRCGESGSSHNRSLTPTAIWPRDGCPNTAHMGSNGCRRCRCCRSLFSSLKRWRSACLGLFFFSPFQNKCGVTSLHQKFHSASQTDTRCHHSSYSKSACSDLSADKCNLTYQFTHEPSAMRSIKCSLLCSSSQSNLRKLGFVER